jgi:hypothetical protein
MAKSTVRRAAALRITPADRIASANVSQKWESWRAKSISELMNDGMSYREAVTWSRRGLKKAGKWA